MSTIDAHIHLYPEEVNRDPVEWSNARSETHWATLCTRIRKDGKAVQDFPSVTELLKDMDEAGVERVVLQGWYWQWPETCALQNAFYERCVREHPDRLSAFACLHPGAGEETCMRLVRSARERGFCGLGELSPHSQGFDIGDPLFLELVEQAGEERLPINLHVTEQEGGSYPGKVPTPLRDFIWLAHNFPRTNFILAHWGGRLPLLEEEGATLYNVFFDTAASPLIYGQGIWSTFLEVVPQERVLFGSDYPLRLYPKDEQGCGLGRFLAEARSGGAGAGILGENAKRLLKLP